MPENTNVQENNQPSVEELAERLEERIGELNRSLNLNLNYASMAEEMDNIFDMSNEDEAINARVGEFYIRLGQQLTNSLVHRRSYIWSLNSLKEAHDKSQDPAVDYSIMSAQQAAREITAKFCDIYYPGYVQTHPTFGLSRAQADLWMLDEINKHTYENDIPQNMKKWERKGFAEDVKTSSEILKGYNINGKMDGKTSKNMLVAEIYYKNELAKQEMKNHSFLWRWFSPRARAYKNYIKETQALLDSVGFKADQHAESTKDLLKKVAPPYDIDLDRVKEQYKNGLQKDKQDRTVELFEARAKYNKAWELEQSPETSFVSKITPFLQKYGIDPTDYNVKSHISNMPAIHEAAEAYDKRRETELMRKYVGRAFYFGYKAIVESSTRNGKEINVAEALKDARAIAGIAAQHYTMAYEIEELTNGDKPFYHEYLDQTMLTDQTQYFIQNSFESPDAKIDPNYADRIKNDIAKTLGEWNSDLKRLAEEDKQVAFEQGAAVPGFDKEAGKSNDNRVSLPMEELDERKNIISSAPGQREEPVVKQDATSRYP